MERRLVEGHGRLPDEAQASHPKLLQVALSTNGVRGDPRDWPIEVSGGRWIAVVRESVQPRPIDAEH